MPLSDAELEHAHSATLLPIGARIPFCAGAIPTVARQVSAAFRIAPGEWRSVVGSGYTLSGTLGWRLLCG